MATICSRSVSTVRGWFRKGRSYRRPTPVEQLLDGVPPKDGVSGKLYQSCLVMYAQPWAEGIVGPAVNQTLERLPAVKTTLGEWLAQHPDSQILSTQTGHQRNYQGYPYGTYYTDGNIIFPVRGSIALQCPYKSGV